VLVARTLCPDGNESSTAPNAGASCPHHPPNVASGPNRCEHGTGVAGVIAGGRTAAFGANGMAPDANILPIQVASRVEWQLFGDCSRARPCLGIYDSDVAAACSSFARTRGDTISSRPISASSGERFQVGSEE
jgi:hypothetical protein